MNRNMFLVETPVKDFLLHRHNGTMTVAANVAYVGNNPISLLD